jgi:hypothetical protein
MRCRGSSNGGRAGFPPREAHNAPLHLFSAAPELVGYGTSRYERHSDHTSGLIVQLFDQLHAEDVAMAYTMADFQRDFMRRKFPKLSPEERQELLQMLPPEERLAGLPPEERLAGLPPEERLAGLSEEQIRQYLDALAARQAAPRRKPRHKR